MKNEKIIVGKINGFHGVKGFIKLFSETRPRESILNYEKVYLKVDGKWQLQEIEKGQVHGKNIIIKLKGYDNRNDVEFLLGAQVAVDEEMLPSLSEDEYYWRELIGLTVFDLEGVNRGIIKEIMETGANDVFVIKHQNNTNELIPYSKEIVQSVNLAEKKIVVDWEFE